MRPLKFIATGLFLCFYLSAQSANSNAPDHVPGRLIVHHNGQPSDAAAALAFARHGVRVRTRMDKLGTSVIEVPAGTEEMVKQSLEARLDKASQS